MSDSREPIVVGKPALGEIDFRCLFEATPGQYLVVAPDRDFTILAASDAYLKATLTRRDGPHGIIGLPMFVAFPDPPDDESATGVRNLRKSFERARATGKPDVMPIQHYNIRRPDGSWEERHWMPRNTPVVRDATVRYLIHEVEDVTKLVQAQKAEQTAREAVQSAQLALDSARADIRRQHGLLEDASVESARLRKESDALRAKMQSLLSLSQQLREKGPRR